MAEMQIIVFKVGEEVYGADVSYIKGIEKMLPIVRVPTSVPHVLGVVNLRGKVLPVLSLQSKFGVGTGKDITDNSRFLIVSYDDMDVALLVDDVSEIETINEENYFDTPIIVKSSDTEYVKAIINNGKRLIVLIDHMKLIPMDNQDQMKDILKEDKKEE